MEIVAGDFRCYGCKINMKLPDGSYIDGGAACSGCRKALYCSRKCQKDSYSGHREECFEVMKSRVFNGDVHKDDEDGEEVLKKYLKWCRKSYGDLDGRTLEVIMTCG
jgi:hypothetical protein